MTPWYTDQEVDDMCAGLVNNAAKVRHLRAQGLTHPLLNDPAVMVFLRANPYADKQAMRLIYEEIASAFSGATLTCTSAADMDTGKWHLYLDVDTHGELDMDAQIQREMVLHSTFLQNQQLHRAKEYFHVTVS